MRMPMQSCKAIYDNAVCRFVRSYRRLGRMFELILFSRFFEKEDRAVRYLRANLKF